MTPREALLFDRVRALEARFSGTVIARDPEAEAESTDEQGTVPAAVTPPEPEAPDLCREPDRPAPGRCPVCPAACGSGPFDDGHDRRD